MFPQAQSQSTAVTSDHNLTKFNQLHPYSQGGALDTRPRTAERRPSDNLFFQTRPKSSGAKFRENAYEEEGVISHLNLPLHNEYDQLLSPPGAVFQESRANSAMSFIDDPGKNNLLNFTVYNLMERNEKLCNTRLNSYKTFNTICRVATRP